MKVFPFPLPISLADIAEKVGAGGRLTPGEAGVLAREAPLALLGLLAVKAKERRNGNEVYYNRNFHIEPSNICRFNCRFCSYRRAAGAEDAWEYTLEEMLTQTEAHRSGGATEAHIVGSVHPERSLGFYEDLLRAVKAAVPGITLKAFSAVEILQMAKNAGVTLPEVLACLKAAGLDAIPGGGAEIFAERVRERICAEKAAADNWIAVHREAHRQGIPSNATMLYGHIETWEERIDHLDRLRILQDETAGFDAFIPLKYRRANNPLAEEVPAETGIVEDMRVMALSRLYLDNIPHLKAYWPMFGRTTAQLALAFGADDMDGTIDDSTRIYTLAGSEEDHPAMTTEELEALIRSAGYTPVERDTFYNPVKKPYL